jgi:DNA polymerase elongation subunit (family B)
MNYYTNVQTVGNRVFYRGIEDGQRVMEKVDYEPTLFIPTNKQEKYKTIFGKTVSPIHFKCIKDAREFVREYADVDNFEIYGNTQYHYAYISDNFSGNIDYNASHLVIANLDIEVDSSEGFPEPELASREITAITYHNSRDNHFYVFAHPYDDGEYKPHLDNVYYFHCKSEVETVSKFLDHWEKLKPDIMTGWNIVFFDIPYLLNRISKILGEDATFRLSPWKRLSQRNTVIFHKQHTVYDLTGIASLDYLELYKKFAPNPQQESYALNNIAHVELKRRKLSYEEYGNLHTLWKENHQKFVEYNITDVDLVNEIDRKMQLIALVLGTAYDAKVNYNDVFSQVRMWDTILFNDLRQQNFVIPQKQIRSDASSYGGAYVKDPQVGMHDWVISEDLNSLYPHLIAQYNISPDTIVGSEFMSVELQDLIEKKFDSSGIVDTDRTMAANGHHFRTDKQGFLPRILMEMYDVRKQAKKKMLVFEAELERVEREMKDRGIEVESL